MEREIKQIEDILHLIRKIKLTDNLIQISYPLNEKEEKAKFFSISNYKPKFVYSSTNHNKITKILQEIKTIKDKIKGRDVSAEIRIIIEGMLKDKENTALMLLHLGKKEYRILSQHLYGTPKHETYKIALDMINNISWEQEEKSINVEEGKRYFEEVLHLFGLNNWKVMISSNHIAVSVNTKRKTITIPKSRKFTLNDIKRLIVHEIGTHVFRAENALRQKIDLLKYPFPNYILTEEGMALYREFKNNLMDHYTLKEYALRYVAVYDMLMNNDFNHTFSILNEYVSREDAWRISLRAYRGGGQVKDYVYLEGFLTIKGIIDRKGNKVEELLNCCLSNYEYLPLLEKLKKDGLLFPPYYNNINPEHIEIKEESLSLTNGKDNEITLLSS